MLAIFQRSTSMKRVFSILLSVLLAGAAASQSLPIKITITIAPPYPTSLTYYADHPEQVIIHVANTTREEQSFRLVGSITGTDNNVKVVAKDRGASGIITLNPNESRLLTVPEIQDLFDARKFVYTGINYSRAQIDDGLPEGTYEVCGYAVDAYQVNVQKAEQTCSNPIFVTNLEPPIIITPVVDAQVEEMPVQNLVFTWTLPASAPPTTQYTLKMVEVMGNLNPNNAIQSATTPIFFERSVPFNTLLYGPMDPPLVVGRKYAFVVTARDPLGKAVFRNGGNSVVQAFTYGMQVPQVAVQEEKKNKAVIIRPIALLSPVCKQPAPALSFGKTEKADSANVFFKWETAESKSEKYFLTVTKTDFLGTKEILKVSGLKMSGYQVFKKSVPFPFVNGQTYGVQVKAYQTPSGNASVNESDYSVLAGQSAVCYFVYKDEDPNKETKHFTATVKYRFDGANDLYPYEGKVAIRKYYRIADTLSNKVYADSLPAILINGLENNLMGTVQTNGKGQFTLDFDTYKTLKSLPSAYSGYPSTAQLQPFYRIYLNNPYLTENRQAFFLKGKDTTNVGVVEVIAQSYSLRLNLKKGYISGTYANQLKSYKEALDGVEVKMVRKTKAANIPFYEGTPTNKVVSNPGGTTIGKETAHVVSNASGAPEAIVHFDKLFISADPSDQYFIQLKDKKGKTFEQAFAFSRPVESSGPKKNPLWNVDTKHLHSATNDGGKQTDEKGEYMSPKEMLDYIQQSSLSYEKVNANRYKVDKELVWGTTDPPLSNLTGRIQYSYPDGLGGQRPLANQQITLKSYLFKIDPSNPSKNTEYINLGACGGGSKSVCSLASMDNKQDPLMSGVSFDFGPQLLATTTTDANGYFQFKDIPMWDSVRDLRGTYKLVSKALPHGDEKTIDKNVTKEEMVTYVDDLKQMKYLGQEERMGQEYASKLDPLELLRDAGKPTYVNDPLLVTAGIEALDVLTAKDLTAKDALKNTGSLNGPKFSSPALKKNLKGGPMPFDEEWEEVEEVQVTQDGESFKLRRVLRIKVENLDFCSPSNDIVLQPLETKDVGTLNTLIQSFKLNLAVTPKDEPAFRALANVQLLLQKKGDLYPGEAEKKSTIQFKQSQNGAYRILDRVLTGHGAANGIANTASANYFYHLVGMPSDYALEASTNDTLNSNVSYAPHTYFLSGNLDDYYLSIGQSGSFGEFTYDYKEPVFTYQLKMDKKDPIVAGRVLLGIPKATAAVSYAKLLLGANSGGNELLAFTKTDGYFTYTNLPVGVARKLKISKAGYHFTDSLGNKIANASLTIPALQKGMKWFKNLYMVPDGTITGYVVNEQGEHVPATYKVENMTLMQETEEQCELSSSSNSTSSGSNSSDVLQEYSTGGYASANWSAYQNGYNAHANTRFFENYAATSCKQTFKAYAVPGQLTKLIITPNDLRYFPETIVLSNPSTKNELGAVKVITRKHRIAFVVRDPKKTGPGSFIPNVKIKILDTVLTTGQSGGVKYEFENVTTQNFRVIVLPASNSNYIPQEITFTNEETKEYKSFTINLEMGQEISGKVTFNGQPLQGALVHAEQGGNGLDRPVATTSNDGMYTLRGIKTSGVANADGNQLPVPISVVAPHNATQTIVGQTKNVNVVNGQLVLPGNQLNFALSGYNGLNITKLLGYDVKVTALQANANGTATVSGEIVLNKQTDFEIINPNNPIRFEKIKVSANSMGKKDSQGIPYAEPEGDLKLVNYTVRTRFRDAYNMDFEHATGQSAILVKKNGPLSGSFYCKTRIVDNSFDFPGSYFSFKNPSNNVNTQFYLASGGGETLVYNPKTKKTEKVKATFIFTTDVAMLASSEGAYGGQSSSQTDFNYNLTDKDGKALRFKLLEFEATSAPSESYFDNKSIRIKPEVTAHIDDWKDPVTQLPKQINVPLDEVKISNQGISPIKNTGIPIEFQLEEWKISISNWKLSTQEGGFTSSNGTINTNILNIPFKKFRLRAREILVDNIQLSQIKVGDVLPLVLHPNPTTTFGYDPKTGNDLKGHYVFRLLGANGGNVGKIAKSNLEGFKNDLGFKAFTLVSEGSQYVDFSTDVQTVRVNNIIDFQPNQLTIANGSVDLDGTIDFGIPRLQDIYGGFAFQKAGNGIGKKLKPMAFQFDIGKGYVQFATTTDKAQVLSENYLELHGTATEPGKLPYIPVVITKKSANNIAMLLDAPTYELKLGSKSMLLNQSNDPLQTGAKVVANDWDYLRLTGKLKGFNGLKEQEQLPLTLVVYGEIKAENSQLKVSEINTPFGNMNLTLDFAKPEMRGTLEINGVEISPGIGGSGVAEICVGTPGFYMMVAAEATFPVPILSPMKAGILLGAHSSVPPEVFTKVQQYNYHKTTPCDYQGLIGFLVTGRKDIIEPVNEQMGVPGIFQADVQLEVGIDASVMMNFSKSAELTIAAGVFGKALLALGSNLSCTFMSFGATVDAQAVLGLTNKQVSGSVCAGMSLTGKFQQDTPLLVGCGPEIVSFNESLAASIRISANSSTGMSCKFKTSGCESDNSCK